MAKEDLKPFCTDCGESEPQGLTFSQAYEKILCLPCEMKRHKAIGHVCVDEENPAPEFIADNVNHPAHYNSGAVETIEGIEAWELGFHLGNAVKYVARAGKKDPKKEIEDLEKAIWYIRRYIHLKQGGKARPNEMPQIRETK